MMEEIQAVQQAFSNLNFYHAFFCAFFAIPSLINLYSLFTYKNFASLNKKIWYVMPLIFFLLCISLLGGLNISATQRNFVSPMVLMMWIYWILTLVGEIMRIKILKVARRTSKEAMLRYVRFCKILYISNLVAFAFIYFGVA